MTKDEFVELIEAEFEQVRKLHMTKGEEYIRGGDDRLANFKRHAAELDLRPEQVWAVYASKHWDAIVNYIKRGEVLSDESIEGRIRDEILYLYLLLALVLERQRGGLDDEVEEFALDQHRDPIKSRDKYPVVDSPQA